jgi:tRNA pseudouridine32 synthase/23S rRNA pseudouridine746 synthase
MTGSPLPTREGVGASCVVLPDGPWPTIAACLMDCFARVTPQAWAQRIASGQLVDASGAPVSADRPYERALKVYYYRDPPAESEWPESDTVVYRDDRIVVADKPHFMPVTPSGRHLHQTLLVRLKRRLGIDSLAPVHRIDRETAGLVLFTVDPASRGAYQRLFAERRVEKRYECIAPWRDGMASPFVYRSRLVDDAAHFMRMTEAEGEPNAETRIRLIERRGVMARYELTPATGKRHQLRVHCASLGMPIVGDRIYPALQPADTDDPADPLRLLAAALAFTDPLTGEARRFESGRRLDWPASPEAAVADAHQ